MFARAVFGVASLLLLVSFTGGAASSAGVVRPDATVGGTMYGSLLPTGEYITPLIAPGSSIQRLPTHLRADGTADANGAISSALSPDGKTLLLVTAGYNANFSTTSGTPIVIPFLDPTTGKPTAQTTASFQWIFIYDVGGALPRLRQAIAVTSAFDGVAWDPRGTRFYVSGGHDDRVYVYRNVQGTFVPDAPFPVLGNVPNTGNFNNTTPQTAGLAVSADGGALYVANYNSNSISIVDTRSRKVTGAFAIPGADDLGGQYPIWVTAHTRSGRTDKFYVSDIREGKIVVFTASGARSSIVVGGEPAKSIVSHDGRRLYVANPNLDAVDEIDTATDRLVRVIDIRRPGYRYYGANPNSLALDARDAVLYVTIAGENAIGVIDTAAGRLVGRIPTAWYPSSVQVSSDGSRLYVSNMKTDTGPNPFNDAPAAVLAMNTTARNDYDLANLKGGLETLPIPDTATLSYLSAIVDANNLFDGNHAVSPMMRYLRTKIKHVIFIQKENRTYDQVLGDLPEGNGDPRLTLFPQPLTPNFHALATQFTDLDNFYTAGDVSQDGWNWDFEGYSNDINRQGTPLNYAGNGDLQASFFGSHTVNGVQDVFGLYQVEDNAGTSDLRPQQTGGYLWDTALRAGVSIRHYSAYLSGNGVYVRHADRAHVRQGYPQYRTLANYTNPYFYQWDTNIPDEWRYEVWKDQFDDDVKHGTFPQFEFMCIMMDHTGSFGSNVAHLTTPELDVASNDHAVGQLIDAVSHSPYWSSTAIFIVEDDSQAGPDHVDSHRSPGFVISAYTRRHQVVNTFYSSVNIDRTMEDLLGMDHLGLNDANAASMDDVFTAQPDLRPYDVRIPGSLCAPPVDPTLVPGCKDPAMRARITPAIAPRHSGAWWVRNTKGLSFRRPDENDAGDYNELLWSGIAGENVPYPEARSGRDFSLDRAAFLHVTRPPVGAAGS